MKIWNWLNNGDKNKFRKGFIFAGIAFLVIVSIVSIFQINIELLEINEIGSQYTSVYWTNLIIKYATMLFAFIIIFAFTCITNTVISKNLMKFFKEENVEPVKLPNKSLSFFIALVASFFVKDFLAQNLLIYINSASFEINDPIFFKDIGYYMFQRPFLIDLCSFIKGLILSGIVYTIGYYVLIFGACFNGILLESLKKNNVVKHNLINVALFFLVCAVTYPFTMEDMLFSSFGNGLVGAGYTDINIKMVAYKIAPWLAASVVVIAYIFLERNKIKKAVITMSVFPVFWIIVYGTMWATQMFFVTPNEFSKESEYIGHNLASTKQAYNLDSEEVKFLPSGEFNVTSMETNADLINNINISDKEATLKALNQNQAIRGYYNFNDIDMAQYNIDGLPKTAYIGAREVDVKDMNYINKTFQYTHGLGAVMSLVNTVDANGEPTFILNELKPQPTYNGFNITEPRIYFGETTDNNVIVNAVGIDEIDYPEGDKSVDFRYTGTAGIKLNFWNKLLMSMKNADMQMLVSGYINSDSKLLTNRNIIDRVEKIAPFIRFDEDAYMVANDAGKLYWVIDGYTLSTQYPYSEYFQIDGKLEGTIEKYNYIRNSVKAIVDAYNGDVTLYITDRHDPVIMAYHKAYPQLFADLDKEPIPADIQKHLRYPNLLFKIQADKFTRYHVSDVSTFYKGEDSWSIATHNTGNEVVNLEPYYAYITLPNTNTKELVLMLPYTLYGRNSLTALLAIRPTGELIVYSFPKESNVLGTIQLDNKIDQDAKTAKDLNLGAGTKVTREVNVLPVGSSLLYIEPIYIEAVNEDAVPQLTKVAVACGNNLSIGNNLSEALNKLINRETGTIVIEEYEDVTLLNTIDNTINIYTQLKQASQAGDWEEFGKQMNKLEENINILKEKKVEIPVPLETVPVPPVPVNEQLQPIALQN